MVVGMDETSPADHPRSPVDADRVVDRLTGLTDHRFASVMAVGTTGSTNTDLAEAYRTDPDTGDRTALIAEEQITARGRLGRPWSAPPGAQAILSVLLRPESGSVVPQRFGMLPLLIGVAVAEAARDVGVEAAVKWPNDVVVPDADAPYGYRKLAGILVEAVSVDPPAVVVGVGANVSVTAEEFAAAGLDTATSLATCAGRDFSVRDREEFIAAELAGIAGVDAAWRAGGAATEAVRARYRQLSVTLGSRVRAELPGGETLTGRATDLDEHGGLIVDTGSAQATVTAGDVVHLRPAGGDRT